MEHKIVSRINCGAFRYQAWPTVAKSADGTLFVGCSGHRLGHIDPFGKAILYVSRDEGKTWSLPQILQDSWLDDRDVGLLAWGESNLLMCSCNHAPSQYSQYDESPRHGATVRSPLGLGMRETWNHCSEEEITRISYTKISRDNGVTWSDVRTAPIFAPHGPTRLKDGTLFYIGRNFDMLNRKPADVHCYVSHDDGETWEHRSQIPYPENTQHIQHTEPHALPLPNGDLLAAVRLENKEVPGKLQIYTLLSHNDGYIWEAPVLLDLLGSPPHLFLHSSGAVILTYSRRTEPMGEYARISLDGGKTWSHDTLISPEAPDWDHGYPSTVELAGGDLFTVYYMKCPGDDYNSLHSVRWNLSDLK
ncbi:MAG: exo-alpha-sialidase [Clostridia bacterium]|nr:exo-alpha-sialidase [Clostridia bacterium]